MAKITIQTLVDFFGFKVLSGDRESLQHVVGLSEINRAGLELAGFNSKSKSRNHRIIWLSTKENEYSSQLSYNVRSDRYKNMITRGAPAIFLSPNFNDKILINIAKELNYPIIKTNYDTAFFTKHVCNFLSENLAEHLDVHATLVSVYGYGVLIEGRSGVGKSETALSLIHRNHLFIGDDRIRLRRENEKIIGTYSPVLRDLIEVRGIGLIDLSKMYGIQVTTERSEINLIIKLKLVNGTDGNIERLGKKIHYHKLLGIPTPIITIPIRAGRNIVDLIEAAVINLKLQKRGYNFAKELDKRLKIFNRQGESLFIPDNLKNILKTKKFEKE